ncbi:MAG: LamG domain-containing protein [Dehalococcoidia bacterium]|jgi:hypothetical protein
MAVDDAYTKALLHFDGDDASTTFTDESGKVWTEHGDAQLDTAWKEFGTAAGLFDGTADYVSTPNSADFDFGTGDWTVDFWMRRNGASSYGGMFGASIGGGNGLSIGLNFGGTNIRVIWDAAEKIVSGGAVSDLTGTHIAVVRYGNTVTCYIGGTADGTDDCTGDSIDSDGTGAVIGRLTTDVDGYYFTGHVDELRVSKGIARWTANFTPPAYPYAGTTVVEVPAISSPDTFLAPTLGNVFIPALSSPDTFVAPGYGVTLAIPALSAADSFVAPGIMHSIVIPRIPTDDIFLAPMITGMPINMKLRFPNTQGQHISLKFESGEADDGFALFYLRHRMFKTVALSGAKNPNTQGSHISIKIENSVAGDFILEYLAMGLRKTVGRWGRGQI